MKLLSAAEIRAWDAYTIKKEPIQSIDLMERAAKACVKELVTLLQSNTKVHIFCGHGNNGGDGLAIARLLDALSYSVEVYLLHNKQTPSNDCKVNVERLKSHPTIKVNQLNEAKDLPVIQTTDVVVDALYGSGLNKPVDGIAASVITLINASGATVVAIDIPSGLPADVFDDSALSSSAIVQADYTLTFQLPKQSFLFAETGRYCGQVKVLDIGLHPGYEPENRAHDTYVDHSEIKGRIKKRNTFDHKGTYGHALLIGGSYGKIGAAVLMSKASVYSGCGLTTAYVPKVGYTILQTTLPEAMVLTDDELYEIRNFPETHAFDAIGIGPGLGTHEYTLKGFEQWLKTVDKPVVIDADGINLCARLLQDHHFSFHFPKQCIITPHPKEFDRLAGLSKNSFERLEKAIGFAQKHQVVLVLKGAYTRIVTAQGKVYVNATGNPGMATGGSGDVLTGVITSLLAQGYSLEDAAIIGVYKHGRAGDLAMQGKTAIAAGDLIGFLNRVF